MKQAGNGVFQGSRRLAGMVGYRLLYDQVNTSIEENILLLLLQSPAP
jgi:hypothetical protein